MTLSSKYVRMDETIFVSYVVSFQLKYLISCQLNNALF